MFKTIKERLAAGERVALDKAVLETALEVVKHVSLHVKLRELEGDGVVKLKDSPRKGRPRGGQRWTHKGRFLKIVSNYRGINKWKQVDSDLEKFDEPHDLAIDPKTQRIIAYAHA